MKHHIWSINFITYDILLAPASAADPTVQGDRIKDGDITTGDIMVSGASDDSSDDELWSDFWSLWRIVEIWNLMFPMKNKTVNLGRSSAIIRYTSAILSALLLLTKGLWIGNPWTMDRRIWCLEDIHQLDKTVRLESITYSIPSGYLT